MNSELSYLDNWSSAEALRSKLLPITYSMCINGHNTIRAEEKTFQIQACLITHATCFDDGTKIRAEEKTFQIQAFEENTMDGHSHMGLN